MCAPAALIDFNASVSQEAAEGELLWSGGARAFALRFCLAFALDVCVSTAMTGALSVASGEWRVHGTQGMMRQLRKVQYSTLVDGTFAALLITLELQHPGRFTRLVYDDADGWRWCDLLGAWVGFIAIVDTCFYFFHRCVLHHPALYQSWHALHHSFKIPVAWSSRASETLEGFATILCFFAPALFIRMPYWWFYGLLLKGSLWGSWLHTDTTWEEPPWFVFRFVMMRRSGHALHHQYGARNYNFAIFTQFWDRLLGTYKASDHESSLANRARLQQKDSVTKSD